MQFTIESQEAELDRTFAALSSPIRRSIVARLATQPEATVSELAEPFDVSLMAISKHLRVLREAGLVRQRAEGRQRLCSLAPDALRSAGSWIERYERFWEEQLGRLAAFVERPRRDSAAPEEAHNRPEGTR